MTIRRMSVLLTLLLLPSVLQCSGPCRGKSFTELLGMDMFPSLVAGVWEIEGSPTSAFAPRGYIHAVYDHKDQFCLFKVWLIDKCSSRGAERWLDALLNGEHTASSVRPFPPDAAESHAYYAAFSESPVTVKNRPVYERPERNDAGHVQYAVYFTSGRFVVGGENVLCQITSVESAREEFLPILESLSLR